MNLPPTAWSPDVALAGFDATTLHFPDDYDGPVVATLVRRRMQTSTGRAVLYIHGYTDYFFQTHLADAYNANGFDFYALDLRRYGRSLLPGQHPTFCKRIDEYFAEISTALRIITEQDGNDWVLLSGHSTGGLTTSLYADAGEHRDRVAALYLNSPFFELNFNRRMQIVLVALSILGRYRPFFEIHQNRPVPYIESIHQDYHGEWQFDFRWRPLHGFPAYAGWLRAVRLAQQRLRGGLDIRCPVLVMHSDKSIYGNTWRPDFQTGDSILSVDHIRDGSRHLGPDVTVVEIADGLHDLILSRQEVREKTFNSLFMWIASLPA